MKCKWTLQTSRRSIILQMAMSDNFIMKCHLKSVIRVHFVIQTGFGIYFIYNFPIQVVSALAYFPGEALRSIQDSLEVWYLLTNKVVYVIIVMVCYKCEGLHRCLAYQLFLSNTLSVMANWNIIIDRIPNKVNIWSSIAGYCGSDEFIHSPINFICIRCFGGHHLDYSPGRLFKVHFQWRPSTCCYSGSS